MSLIGWCVTDWVLRPQQGQCIYEMKLNLKKKLETNINTPYFYIFEAKEEMRRDRAIMIIKLSEQQDSETVALQALEEAEQELSKTEEALAKEKAMYVA